MLPGGGGGGRIPPGGCGRGHRQAPGQAGRRGQVAAALSHACRLFVCCRQYETGSRASEDQCQALSRTVQVCGRRVSCTG